MSSDLQTQLTEAEKSFKKACEQIIHLNRRLDEMAKRYDKASRENHRSFRYSLRLRMAVSEGVRNMYYEYAANKADLISELRYKVAGSMSVRNVADNVGLGSGGNVNANRAEGEQREWGPRRDGGSAAGTNPNAAHTRRLSKNPRLRSSTQRERRHRSRPLATGNEEVTWPQGADMVPVVEGIPEPVEEIPEPVGEIPEPVVTVEGIPEPVVVGGIPEGPYDYSDMGSPSTGSSGSTIASNEASEDLELVETYFTNDYAENSSESSQPSGSNWT